MAFRYLNPGYLAMMDKECTGLQSAEPQYSRTGVSFSQTDKTKGVILPEPLTGEDFWARFDAYIPAKQVNAIRCYAPGYFVGNTKIWGGNFHGCWIDIGSAETATHSITLVNGATSTRVASGSAAKLGIRHGAINTFVLHVGRGTQGFSTIDVIVGGEKYSMATKNEVVYDSLNPQAGLSSKNKNYPIYFSNIIFSNEELSPAEQVLIVPIKNTETDMTTAENGGYVGKNPGQYVLQSADIDAMEENASAGSTITGIMIAGNPAYKTNAGKASLIGISEKNDTITEHGTVELSENPKSAISLGWGLQNTTVEDLRDMKFGWKIGT